MTSRQSRSLLLLAGSPLLALAANSASSQMYKHFPTPSTWEVAKITCSGYGGMLATVDGAEENQRTMAECASERCWIGLNDVVTEGSFVWDSSNMQPAFRKWAPGEPSNTQYTDDAFYGTTDEDCVYIHGATYSDVAKRSDWGDHPCVQKLPFVCQIPVHFEVSEYAQDWETAQAQCETEGGRLASIESLADNSKALGVCEDDRCWIGLNDRMTEGTMRWADGKALVDGTNNVYRNWAPGEPSNTVYTKDEFYGTTDEDCVYIHGAKYSDAAKRGKWGDHPCTQKMHAICEVPSASQFVAFAEAKTWQEADEHCTSIADGATLASVASMGQNGIVENQCPDDRCWIGLNDRQLEGRFVWATGTLLEKGDFKQWALGEPSNTQYTDDKWYGTTDEDCVYIHGANYATINKRGNWGDHPCDQKLPAVCEVPSAYMFKYYAAPLKWLDAEEACKGVGGHLANIQGFGENGRVFSQCDNQRCWIGANDRYAEGDWQWTDGTPMGNAHGEAYTSWARGEPDNTKYADGGDEDCAYIHGLKYPASSQKQGYWGDHRCDEAMPYVCQIPVGDAADAAMWDELPGSSWFGGGGSGSGGGGGGLVSTVFRGALYLAVIAAVLFGLVKKGVLREEQVMTPLCGVKDVAVAVIVKARDGATSLKDKVSGGKKAPAAQGAYVLMNHDDDAAGDELLNQGADMEL